MRAYVRVNVTLEIDIDDNVEMSEVIRDMEHTFTSGTIGAEIVSAEVGAFKIVREEQMASPDCHVAS